ncbi:hypothetical protein Hanom_Chr07g00671111 [Helianthus anomalus]
MKGNHGKKTRNANKFWMYPRFVQMILDAHIPNLSKVKNDILKISAMKEDTLKMMKTNNKFNEGVVPRKMIGYLGSLEYVAPENEKWRHDDSGSDNEEPVLDAVYEKKRKDEEAGGSNMKRKGKKILIDDDGDDNVGGEDKGDEDKGDDEGGDEGGDGKDDVRKTIILNLKVMKSTMMNVVW